ncbi:hypothetical protein UFOVP117_7 [uncultured Caudovirales phage]|uniref:Uncharacterized protein n=1 Tax=uncultured Caudovirales phage TaxID=2100421 RepID=A0A6J5L580_9CAUD|nr:hypothetical protein UFOVP117_7 [uncultured Caudovirales phage]
MEFNKEYFSSPYYFYIKEGKDSISVYFSVSNTLTEARKKDEIVKFDKKDKEEVKKTISKIQKEKKLKNNSDVKKTLNKKKDELGELVDYDGSFLSSKIPIYNPYLSPKGTMDQEVVATRQTNNPITRGYRVYWGEGEEETDEVINETDFSDAFGYEETKDKNGPETFKTFVKELGLDKDEAADRTRQQGKEPDVKKHKRKLQNVPKKIKDQKGFIDKMTISEKSELENIKKQQVVDMVEDIVLGKKSSDKEVGKKKNTLSKLLMKNLENIKKIADKEGIEINDLVKILKK